MKEVLLLCLMVLVVMGNNSGRWTKKSEEDPKDLKDEKENMKEYISNKIYTTTTSTSTMPPTTSTSKMPEIKDEMKELKEEMRKERKEESEKNKQDTINKIIFFCNRLVFFGVIPQPWPRDGCEKLKELNWDVPLDFRRT